VGAVQKYILLRSCDQISVAVQLASGQHNLRSARSIITPIMDPISILTTSAALAGTCVKIYTYIKSIQGVDNDIRVLGTEVDQLSIVLDSISESFKDPLLAHSALESQTGHEAQHWRNVFRSLNDCKETLTTLEEILETMKSKVSGFLRRPKSRIKLDMNSGEISLCKQQIAAYRRTMQLSLQLITVYVLPTIQFINNRSSVLSHEVASTNLSSRLDVIMIDLQQLSQFVRSRSSSGESSDGNSSRVMNNLEDCIRSAEKLVSSASTIVSSRSTIVGGSVFGETLSEQQRTRIYGWIMEPGIFEQDSIADIPMPSEVSDILEAGSGEPSLASIGMEAATEEVEPETRIGKNPKASQEGASEEIENSRDLVRNNPEDIGLGEHISVQLGDLSMQSLSADSANVSQEGERSQ